MEVSARQYPEGPHYAAGVPSGQHGALDPATTQGTANPKLMALALCAAAGSSALLAVLLLPPHALGAAVCDAFGAPFLLLMAGGGASLVIVAGIDHWHSSLRVRMAATAITAAILLATFFKLNPGCIASPYAAVDPLVSLVWLDHVAETMSLPTMLQLRSRRPCGSAADRSDHPAKMDDGGTGCDVLVSCGFQSRAARPTCARPGDGADRPRSRHPRSHRPFRLRGSVPPQQ